jgi:hypothetical protein
LERILQMLSFTFWLLNWYSCLSIYLLI